MLLTSSERSSISSLISWRSSFKFGTSTWSLGMMEVLVDFLVEESAVDLVVVVTVEVAVLVVVVINSEVLEELVVDFLVVEEVSPATKMLVMMGEISMTKALRDSGDLFGGM